VTSLQLIGELLIAKRAIVEWPMDFCGCHELNDAFQFFVAVEHSAAPIAFTIRKFYQLMEAAYSLLYYSV
jgi:hypothetical protein